MPKTTSAQKALRQNISRNKRNNERKSNIKMVVKKFKKLIETNQIKEAELYLPTVYKTLDKIGKSGLIKHGKINRIKSRLTKKIKK